MKTHSKTELLARMNWNCHNEIARVNFLQKLQCVTAEEHKRQTWSQLPKLIKNRIIKYYTNEIDSRE